MRIVHLTCILTIVLFSVPRLANAHAFAQKHDLAMPLAFYLAGAGFAVALSFLGPFFFMRSGSVMKLHFDIQVPSRCINIFKSLLRAVSLVIFALIIATGLFGPEASTENLATVFVWVIWWVGMTLMTALVVDLWSIANPFKTLIDVALRFLGRDEQNRPLSTMVGWFSVAGLICLSWTELISSWSENPRVMTLLIAIYIFSLFLGSLIVGRKNCLNAVDPITWLFDLLGHMAPVSIGTDKIRIRVPTSGLTVLSLTAAKAVFVVTLIAIVLFDGLSETPVWTAILQWVEQSQTLRPALIRLQSMGADLLAILRSIALLATILIAIVLYALLSVLVWITSGRTKPLLLVFTTFSSSLLPIAVAYHFAHYISYIALAGQLIIPISSDPFGMGWDLFGGAGRIINTGVITARGVWWTNAIVLVIGHVLSVFVAHTLALRLFTDIRKTIVSQFPIMVFMVGLTSFSLWILAQPVVNQ